MLLSFISSIAKYLWFGLGVFFGCVFLIMLFKSISGDKDLKNDKGILLICTLLCTGVALWSGSYIFEPDEEVITYEIYDTDYSGSNISFKSLETLYVTEYKDRKCPTILNHFKVTRSSNLEPTDDTKCDNCDFSLKIHKKIKK